MTTEITRTKYVIEFEPKMQGWIAFKTVTSRSTILEREPLTNPKPAPHLAARALERVLRTSHNAT